MAEFSRAELEKMVELWTHAIGQAEAARCRETDLKPRNWAGRAAFKLMIGDWLASTCHNDCYRVSKPRLFYLSLSRWQDEK